MLKTFLKNTHLTLPELFDALSNKDFDKNSNMRDRLQFFREKTPAAPLDQLSMLGGQKSSDDDPLKVVLVGLGESGKTTLQAVLLGEDPDEVAPGKGESPDDVKTGPLFG